MAGTDALSMVNQLASISGVINAIGIVLGAIALTALVATPILLYKIYRKLK